MRRLVGQTGRAGIRLAGLALFLAGAAYVMPGMRRAAIEPAGAAHVRPGEISSADVSAEDAAAIKEVVRKYVAAREENDAAAVTALFTPDADQLVSSGEWRKGRDALVRGAMASSQRSGGKRTIAVETIRAVAPAVVLADGPYEIAASPGNAARKMWATFVMTKQPDGWRIAAIRNMLPAPPPPAAAGAGKALSEHHASRASSHPESTHPAAAACGAWAAGCPRLWGTGATRGRRERSPQHVPVLSRARSSSSFDRPTIASRPSRYGCRQAWCPASSSSRCPVVRSSSGGKTMCGSWLRSRQAGARTSMTDSTAPLYSS